MAVLLVPHVTMNMINVRFQQYVYHKQFHFLVGEIFIELLLIIFFIRFLKGIMTRSSAVLLIMKET